MDEPVRLAVAGYGLIGRQHVAAASGVAGVEIVAIADPALPVDAPMAVHATLEEMLDVARPQGVILATPTPDHVAGAAACVARGIPVLVEKPLSDDLCAARSLVETARRAGVALLVGHHRRHNPIIAQARKLIGEGALGDIRAAQVTCWFHKPDSYFDDAPWRKRAGAGPISVNIVHDVDLLRHLVGEVESVQAQTVPARRGYDNEDLAAAVLRFENGALGTLTVSDAIAAPWSWEMTARENPAYASTDQSCYLIGGSEGSLSIPDLRLWRHDGAPHWWHPITATVAPRAFSDPLVNQVAHFAEVVRGRATPLVSGAEGLRTLAVVDAIQRAARTGATAEIDAALAA